MQSDCVLLFNTPNIVYKFNEQLCGVLRVLYK